MKILKIESEGEYGAMAFEDNYAGSYSTLWDRAKEEGKVYFDLPLEGEDELEGVIVTAYEFNMDLEAFNFMRSLIDYDESKSTNIFIAE